MASKKQKIAQYRNFSKFQISSMHSNLNKVLTNMPYCGCLTIEERNVLIQLRNCINNMVLSHWDKNTKEVLSNVKEEEQ